MADDNVRTGTTTNPNTTTLATENQAREEANRDPITSEPGAHPVGTGVGAATGGTVGAVVGGAVGGPVGAMIGAAVGGLAGGLAGKGMAESVNPTEEDTFWREHYTTRPYGKGRSYEDLQPAYRYGWEARTRHTDLNWNDVEGDLGRDWTARNSTLGWDEARPAVRDAWNRVEGRHRYDNLEDPYWRQSWQSRPYTAGGSHDYDADFQPAYRYGYESGYSNTGRRWEETENDLERGWEKAKGKSRLTWERAKDAVKDAWYRATNRFDDDEDRYWRESYRSRPYYKSDYGYDAYRPAYSYGYLGAQHYQGRSWNDVENDLGNTWEQAKGQSRLSWDNAKDAVRDAYDRASNRWSGTYGTSGTTGYSGITAGSTMTTDTTGNASLGTTGPGATEGVSGTGGTSGRNR